MCKVYTGYCGTSEIEHGLCACTDDNPLAKARGLCPYRRTNHALSLTCLLFAVKSGSSPYVVVKFEVDCNRQTNRNDIRHIVSILKGGKGNTG